MQRRFALFVLSAIWVPVQAADPAILQIKIVEGDAAVYPLGSRATHGITVQLTDETGKPAEGVAVNFVLPESGPGGVFSNKSKTEIETTGADGRATVWGMQWNRVAGSFEVRITAVKGAARAGTVCSQYLSGAPAPAAVRGNSGHKWLWIVVGIAGGAGAAVVIAGRIGSASPTAAAVSGGVTSIGSPTIALGHP